MATMINYHTNEEAYQKICPEQQHRMMGGRVAAVPLGVHCIGSNCADWIWSQELTDEGKQQGHCGKVVPELTY